MRGKGRETVPALAWPLWSPGSMRQGMRPSNAAIARSLERAEERTASKNQRNAAAQTPAGPLLDP